MGDQRKSCLIKIQEANRLANRLRTLITAKSSPPRANNTEPVLRPNPAGTSRQMVIIDFDMTSL